MTMLVKWDLRAQRPQTSTVHRQPWDKGTHPSRMPVRLLAAGPSQPRHREQALRAGKCSSGGPERAQHLPRFCSAATTLMGIPGDIQRNQGPQLYPERKPGGPPDSAPTTTQHGGFSASNQRTLVPGVIAQLPPATPGWASGWLRRGFPCLTTQAQNARVWEGQGELLSLVGCKSKATALL